LTEHAVLASRAAFLLPNSTIPTIAPTNSIVSPGPSAAGVITMRSTRPRMISAVSVRSRSSSRASAQWPAGQELKGVAHALDEHHAVGSLGSPRISLQPPRLQHPVDRPAQHHAVVAQVMQPPATGAARQAEFAKCPTQRDAGALVADRGGEPAAVVTQVLEPVPPSWPADLALDLLQVIGAFGFRDDRLCVDETPFCASCRVAKTDAVRAAYGIFRGFPDLAIEQARKCLPVRAVR
jgi:hypothetical protein